MRFSALIPLACAVLAFVLSMLCLLAGHKPGFMEDYNIITVNTSALGENLISTNTSSSATPTSTSSSFGSWFSSTVENITDSIEGDLNGVLNDIADELSEKLGIEEWYSLHLMTMCDGTYSPNATTKGAGKNITHCSNETAMYHFDLTKELNKALEVGGLHINLTDIHWSDKIQDGLDALNAALDATFVLYVIGIVGAGLAIITSLVAIFMNGSRWISFGNWGLCSTSFLGLLIASIIITVVQGKAAHIINKYGNDIGAYAYKGKKYLAITWIATVAMGIAATAWVVEFCLGKRQSKREYTEKSSAHHHNRRSDEAALNRPRV